MSVRLKIVGVIQARTGSSRLPGKVLRPVAGAPMLQRMIERVQGARELDELVVATTSLAIDGPIRDLCRQIGVPCHAGHPTDLLDRHVQATRTRQADAVAKIPSDCPLIDPAVIDRVLSTFRASIDEFDYVSNLHPATYPDGNDVEVMTMAALEAAWQQATRPHEREHTTPFLWDRPERFRIGNVKWETGLDYSMSHRFTVDYAEDYEFVKAVFKALWREGSVPFSLNDIVSFLDEHPEVADLNRHLAGVNWYRHHLHELRTVTRRETVPLEDT